MKKIFVLVVGGLLISPFAYAANSYGTLNEDIGVGRTLSVGLNTSPTGSWYVVANNDSLAGTSVVSNSSLVALGKTVGVNPILVCTEPQGINCLSITANIVSNVLGATTGHSAGSWVLYNGTVLYVHESGLIPVPTWEIFLNNGGRAEFIQTITEADFHLTVLSIMTHNDPRVK